MADTVAVVGGMLSLTQSITVAVTQFWIIAELKGIKCVESFDQFF